jgi:hypothetical protein
MQSKHNTKWRKGYGQGSAVVHTIAVMGLVMLAGLGIALESSGGWIACPPRGGRIEESWQRRRRRTRVRFEGLARRAGQDWLGRSWQVAAVRSAALLLLAFLTGH